MIKFCFPFRRKCINLLTKALPRYLFSQNNEKNIIKTEDSSTPKTIEEKEEEKSLDQILSEKYNIITEEEKSKLMEDYTQSPTVMKFQEDSSHSNEFFPYKSSSGFNLNTSSELQLKDNPLALQILNEGKIDLTHEKVTLQNAFLQDLSLYSVEEIKEINGKIAQINVGTVDVLPKNSVLLEDIDVYNVPEDKDIILTHNKKQMYVVGHRVDKDILETNKSLINQEGKHNRGEFHVSRNIFEELNFEEFKKKYLFEFESKNVKFHKLLLLREILRFWPFYVFLLFFIETTVELYSVTQDHNLIEKQEMDIFNKVREKYMKDIIVSNELYNRNNYK